MDRGRTQLRGSAAGSEQTGHDGPVRETARVPRPLALRAVEADDTAQRLVFRAAVLGDLGLALVQDGFVTWANPKMHATFGAPADDLIGRDLAQVVVEPIDEGAERRTIGELIDLDLGRFRGRIPRDDGSSVAVECSAMLVQAAPFHHVLRVQEIAENIRVDEALRSSEARFRALADNAPIGVFLSDVGVRLSFVNPRMAQIWGRRPEELVGDRWLRAVIDDDVESLLGALGDALDGRDAETLVHVRQPEGDIRSVSCRFVPVVGGDRQAGFVGSVEDVTDAIAREAELAWQARHDALTGLPNRIELWDRIRNRMRGNSRGGALLFFDLDDFKLVNDTLGHAAGDSLLRAVADRLTWSLRDGDVVARFGGDEFVVFCPTVTTVEEAQGMADRLLTEIREPIEVGSRMVRTTASVGVLVNDGGHADPDVLIRDADVAMYQAKSAGKARTAVFDARAQQLIEHRLDVVSDLRRALAEHEVGVHYQPIVRVSDRRIVGAEALLRYEHSDFGPLPANEVIAIAEASGCIDELGGYVLERATADLAAWRRRVTGWSPGYITVNLAASQLAAPDFEERVTEALAGNGLSPEDLCLELTESQLMTDVERAEGVLGNLAGSGVRLAIDDFGTGYSSLAYLRRFPVSLVKIERSFVADPEEEFLSAIIEAVVGVTRAIGGQVVAEGVETAAQLAAVGSLGCTLVQGYLLGRPCPAHELPADPDLVTLDERDAD